MNDATELSRLQAENARLIALLESHGVEWRPQPTVVAAREPEPSTLSMKNHPRRAQANRRIAVGKVSCHWTIVRRLY